MKGAVYRGPYDLRIEERPKPTAGWNEVVLKIKACGICPIIDLNMRQNISFHVFPLEEINKAFGVAMDFHKSLEVQIEP